MKLRSFSLAAMAASAMLISSCGGSDSPGAVQTPESPTAEEIQDLVESGAVDEIADAAGVSEACVEVSLAMSAATGGMVPGADTGALDVEAMKRSFDAIKGRAPEDLRPDIDIVKNAMAEYMAILASYGGDFTSMMMDQEAAERFAAVFDDASFSEASERFSTWLEEVCSN